MLQQTIFYPLAVPEKWDDIEVQPISKDEDGNEEPCNEQDADFYSVFLHNEEGVSCIADCPTAAEAVIFAGLIGTITLQYSDTNGYLLKTVNNLTK